MKSKPKRRRSIILFGLPFLIGGGVVLVMGLLSLYNSIQAQSWDNVPVTILKLELKTHEGEDGNTYSIETEYEYTYNHRKYYGDCFSFSIGRDNISSHQGLIDEVKSRDPAFAFVNPNQPSVAVLVNEISPQVGLMFPFGMVFFLVGVGIVSGKMMENPVTQNTRQSYLSGEKIAVDNSKSKLALFLLPILSSFFMVFINAIFLIKWVGPAITFYITLGIIILGLWAGWYLSRRSYTQAEIQIHTLPGNTRPFEFSLHIKEEPSLSTNEGGNYRAINTVSPCNIFAKLTISVSEDSGEDKQEHQLLSADFNCTANNHYQQYFVIDTASLRVTDTNPMNQVPEALKKLAERFKKMPQYQNYLNMIEVAGWMSKALQGGSEAQGASQQVNEFLNSSQNNHPVSSKLMVKKGRKKMVFYLPQNIWP